MTGILRELQRGNIRADEKAEASYALEVIRITLTEMRGQDAVARFAELKPARIDPAGCESQGCFSESLGPLLGLVVDKGPGFDKRLRAREVRLELAPRKWPSRVGKPVALLEVDIVERPAPSAPVIGATA